MMPSSTGYVAANHPWGGKYQKVTHIRSENLGPILFYISLGDNQIKKKVNKEQMG